MRVILFFVLTFFLTSTTKAEWKSFFKDELGISYYDKSTIKKHKNKVYLEVLTDYFIPQSKYRILSVITQAADSFQD